MRRRNSSLEGLRAEPVMKFFAMKIFSRKVIYYKRYDLPHRRLDSLENSGNLTFSDSAISHARSDTVRRFPTPILWHELHDFVSISAARQPVREATLNHADLLAQLEFMGHVT